MRRLGSAALLILLLAACTATPGSSASVSEATPSPEPSASATAEATAEATPSPTEAATWEGHPAAGVTLVRTVDPSNPDDPVTQLFIVEADGSQRQITGVSGDLTASFPVWSHDGSQVAFGGSKVGDTGIKGQVGVVNADGSGERELAEGAFPQWSPDGTRIAFNEVDDVTAEPVTMYVVDVETGEITDLGHGYAPQWLDDDRLLYNATSEGAGGVFSTALYLLTLSTGERAEIAPETTAFPSPDRSMVLLASEGVISVAPATDLADATELASGDAPVWSPDSTRVAVSYTFDEQARPIYAVVDLDGSTVVSDIAGSYPTWSPDGTRLALEFYLPDGLPVIHVVEVATGEVLHETGGQQPAWRP